MRPAAPGNRARSPQGARPNQPRSAQNHQRTGQGDRFGPPAADRRPAAPRPARRPNPVARKVAKRRRALVLGRLHNRMTVGFTAVCVLLSVIGVRLVQLQGLDHSGYAAAAADQRNGTMLLNALRGQIVDRNGVVLAYTTNAQDITIDPQQLRTAGITGDKLMAYAVKLAPLVGLSTTAVVKVLSTPGQYAVLAQALPPVTANKIIALDLIGVYTAATTQRQYPGQTTAANVIGLVHDDGTGAAGIEEQYNDVLAGKNGSLEYTVDGNDNVNPNGDNARVSPVNGGTVTLTLDQSLQFTIQQDIEAAMKESGARGVQVAVLSAKTSQVLALASTGTFNSADPNTINPDVAIDPPVQTVFEPGSVNKLVTFAASVDKGLITPQSVVDVPSTLKTGGVTIHDAWYHPDEKFTATGILAESSNIGTVEVAQKLGAATWFKYEQAFGVGEKTGIELPGESGGYLPAMNTWSDSTFANLPFGQGLDMTILQMAGMYQAIANDGVRIEPRIVASTTKPDGTVVTEPTPAGVRVVKASTAETVRTMLESTMLPGGTGTKAAITGYRVSGKTGTAQQPDPAHGGAYSSYLNWDTFAGMVPADKPAFVVAIMVDAPARGLEGGDVAAPLFHEIATYELQHADIPPTGSLSVHVPLQICDATTRLDSPSTVC